MSVRRYALLVAALGTPACASLQGIESVRPSLTALSTAATVAEVHVDTAAAAAVRNQRLAYLTEFAISGPLTPAASQTQSASPQTTSTPVEATPNSTYMELASLLLCDTQRQRLAGAIEVQGVSDLARNALSFDVGQAPGTIVENVALLSAAGRMPQLNTESAQAVYARLRADCSEDLTLASMGSFGAADAGRSGDVEAIFNLVGVLDQTMRAQTVALLQVIVRARRLGELRRYLRENRAEIDTLREGLASVEVAMSERVVLTRRMAAYNYLLAFDALRSDLQGDAAHVRDPRNIAPSIDLRAQDKAVALLDAAAAYDDAMSAGAPSAFGELSKAIERLQAIADHPRDASSAAASIRATMAFIGSLRSLAAATDDPRLQRAIDEAFPSDREGRDGRRED